MSPNHYQLWTSKDPNGGRFWVILCLVVLGITLLLAMINP